MNQEQFKSIVDAVKAAHKALDEHSFITAGGLDTPEAIGTARGHLVYIIPDLDRHLAEFTEPDATPIDVDTFDGDVFNDKRNAWIVSAAFEMDFEPDWGEIEVDYMEPEHFTYTHSGDRSGTYEPGSDHWNECVVDFWNDTMDDDDKANYIIKKDSEGKS